MVMGRVWFGMVSPGLVWSSFGRVQSSIVECNSIVWYKGREDDKLQLTTDNGPHFQTLECGVSVNASWQVQRLWARRTRCPFDVCKHRTSSSGVISILRTATPYETSSLT